MGKNAKSEGERGERIAIGELAKLGIDVCLPMSDNLPFDFIVIYEDQLLKAQVKSGGRVPATADNVIEIDLRSNNWNKKTSKKYTSAEIDTMILCDYNNIYLLEKHEWENKGSFSLRYKDAKNGQSKNCHLAKDYVASPQRMKKVWGKHAGEAYEAKHAVLTRDS